MRLLKSSCVCSVVCVVGIGACKPVQTGSETDASAAGGPRFRLMETAKLGLKPANVEKLAAEGAFRYAPSVSLPALSGELFNSINASAAYKVDLKQRGPDTSVRTDVFTMGQSIGKVALGGTGITVPLPFTLSRGTEVKFVRTFKSLAEAGSAKPANILALPVSAELALKMEEGMTAIIPMNTKIIMPKVARISGLVSGFPAGAQVGAQAVLDGSFQLSITRGKGRVVRVSVAESSGQSAGVNANVSVEFAKPLKVLVLSRDFKASAEINAEASRGIRFQADYEIDLSSPQAVQAYEAAVSGRVILEGADKLVAPWSLRDDVFLDLTGLESLSGVAAANPPVVKLSSTLDYYQTQKRRIAMAVPFFQFGLDRINQTNRVRSIDAKGQIREFLVAFHLFSKDGANPFYRSGERKASGFLIPAQTAGSSPQTGYHWFLWNRNFSHTEASDPKEVMKGLANVVSKTVPILDRYPAGASTQRATSANLMVVFSPAAMDALFDPRVTTPKLLAQALEKMVANMDNKFMLPYNQVPFSGPGAEPSDPDSVRACNAVSKEWGRYYCGFFFKLFVPELMRLQAKSSLQDRMNFFANFYTKAVGLNHIGGDIVARYFSEILALENKAGEIYTKVKLSHAVPSPVTFDKVAPETIIELGRLDDPDLFSYLGSVTGT